MKLKSKDLLGLRGVSKEEINFVLDTAVSFKEILERPIRKVPTLRGLTVVNLFYEPSTRTRISFELAEKRLSADMVNFSATTSSVRKGETLKDTVRNIEAMKIDMVVIRHSASGAPHFVASCLDSSVINAGDGAHEHPTQALLDLFTLREKYKKLEGLKVVIVGDILHSRVARSNIWGLSSVGAEVAVCGPTTLLPYQIERMGVQVFSDLDQALEGRDVVMALRIQLERQKGGLLPSLREYTNLFGITKERLKRLNKNFTIMHPGPINRGIEITPEVADGPYSVILDQVTNGVAVRMAILYLLSGGEEKVE
ncbi:aspartate carbamoyltransferase [candidate division WOR-1 bacterium DG_54_3]|uniref:Aspartate carbamoyltransferase n=1 Tax=candidate division WOR-1 bacterium DG_54_3 TaxID=1703775 RepID=A0A0S7XVM8_UNCSA|nr:MAG: aspartate carbamoyltransferase [candidate division WOR-1 bacterium DG_54_3]